MTNTPETLLPTRYRLQEKLGEGGMGVIYRAMDCLTDENIALKQVQVPAEYLQFMSSPPETVSHNLQVSLAREFQTLAALRHPNIISVLDYGFVQTETELQPLRTGLYRTGLSHQPSMKITVTAIRGCLMEFSRC